MPAIYTRTGDKGDTGLFGGSRVPKQSLRVEAYGTIDEANAAIGAAKAWMERGEWWDRIQHMQLRLFVLAAEVASDEKGRATIGDKISGTDIADLEHLIDDCLAITGPQRAFVVPGRDHRSAAFHQARTVVRRAEREMLRLAEVEELRPELIKYLNRCSDAVYSLARLAEHWHDEQHIRELVVAAVEKILGKTPDDSSLGKATDGSRLGKAPSGPVPTRIDSLDLALAQRLCDAALAKADEMGVAVVFAAVDGSGALLLLNRQPDSLLASIDVAMNKAWSAFAFKRPTADLKKHADDLKGLESTNSGRVIMFPGGVPLTVRGRIIGGIGVSGGSDEEDLAILEHALSTVIGDNR
ncbi:ATP:cob(I)alamin adenosyltransferase [Propionibacterium sp. oral taxon 192 str. F0372]|uniref:cob(I)yrinic acid a,c-diamide adenosyltransferase n=1 Tax=Propionibacterium sp. oral taxon 192 TaxID=671222 RepID=UPI0003528DFC|nr:cob(I)yrinic acid a,c-diamide adenosyltransferase [Propionibacterium sp. oral taxon 192]EPH06069.1 ATP:cob(I)alamin adenosyltransferase [Propionibacterium sp. oral taxon 192 str. F0372]